MVCNPFPFRGLTEPTYLDSVKDELSLRRYAICHQSLSRYWHLLFDDMPFLTEYAGSRSSEIVNNFLNWSHQLDLPLDWRLCIWFAEWAKSFEKDILRSNEIMTEILMKSAATWALTDKSYNRVIVLSWSKFNQNLFVAEKIKTLNIPQKVMLARLDDPLDDDLYYGIFYNLTSFKSNLMRPARKFVDCKKCRDVFDK